MPEHTPIPVDEVMLLERVQYDGYASIEELGETRVGVSENMRGVGWLYNIIISIYLFIELYRAKFISTL